jgi:hypothetical protein
MLRDVSGEANPVRGNKAARHCEAKGRGNPDSDSGGLYPDHYSATGLLRSARNDGIFAKVRFIWFPRSSVGTSVGLATYKVGLKNEPNILM